jgi:signal transduction histidine kinase
MSLRLRLRLGGLLLALVCLAGSVLITRNLNALRRNQDVFVFKDTLFHSHHRALQQIQTAQARLYQHKAGYSREIDDLVGEIIASESLLVHIPRSYRDFFQPSYCSPCHDDAESRVLELEEKIDTILQAMNIYKENISILITTSDQEAQVLHHGQANVLGEDIIGSIGAINASAGRMVNEILDTNTDLVQQAIFTVFTVVACVVLIALAIILYTQFSISRLMFSLLHGTDSIYRDDFSLRLPARNRKDEYGLLASRFNLMAEHLQDRDREIMNKTRQLEEANTQLHDLNENLEGRIRERTAELQRLVEQLRDTTCALEESKRRLEAANVDLLKANQAKSNFLSIVSHELKTPLSVINGFLSLILDERYQRDPQQLREAVEISKRRGQQLTRMIDELIDLSRLDAKAMLIHKEIVAIEPALADVLEQFRDELDRKQIRLSTDSCTVKVLCDPEKIRQVFTNLISNAIKFSPEGSSIDIVCTVEREAYHFVCRDRGIGLAPHESEKIFEKFYQVDSSATRHYGGAGLGLSIVKEIVSLHGGRVWAESGPDEGCSFHFTLPREKEPISLAGTVT